MPSSLLDLNQTYMLSVYISLTREDNLFTSCCISICHLIHGRYHSTHPRLLWNLVSTWYAAPAPITVSRSSNHSLGGCSSSSCPSPSGMPDSPSSFPVNSGCLLSPLKTPAKSHHILYPFACIIFFCSSDEDQLC